MWSKSQYNKNMYLYSNYNLSGNDNVSVQSSFRIQRKVCSWYQTSLQSSVKKLNCHLPWKFHFVPIYTFNTLFFSFLYVSCCNNWSIFFVPREISNHSITMGEKRFQAACKQFVKCKQKGYISIVGKSLRVCLYFSHSILLKRRMYVGIRILVFLYAFFGYLNISIVMLSIFTNSIL